MSGSLIKTTRSSSLDTSEPDKQSVIVVKTRIGTSVLVLAVGWLILCACGVVGLIHYSNTSGPDQSEIRIAEPPPENALDQQADYRLIMFAHPQCGCTHASISQLERILARCEGRVATQLYFFCPNGRPDEWAQSSLWRQAQAIPTVTTLIDRDGQVARKYGISTSGHMLVFDSQKRQRFSGGITISRSHEGDNAGSDSVIAIIRDEPDFQTEAPVFGCLIHRRATSGEQA